MMIMMQMTKKHQEASEETRLIKTTEEADVGDKINPYSQDEKWASSSSISVAWKKYSGGWCMIYGPWGDCVCCSHVQRLIEKRPPGESPKVFRLMREIKQLVRD